MAQLLTSAQLQTIRAESAAQDVVAANDDDDTALAAQIAMAAEAEAAAEMQGSSSSSASIGTSTAHGLDACALCFVWVKFIGLVTPMTHRHWHGNRKL